MKKRRIARVVAMLILPILIFASATVFVSASDEWWFAPIIESKLAIESGEKSDSVVKNELNLECKSAVLLEANTMTVLYEQNADEALPPASVTKVMTLLLVMEAVETGKISLSDSVSVSERAAGMGGSQIFLEVGETMSVEEMIKSVVIASANDAACALAEFVAGSEEAFVKAMNDRARELGMTNTRFENTNGLDDSVENHVTSARDIAIMSAELIKHKKILEYSSIWMDTVRGGLFTLTNTNRLVRYYKGCTGLKTGSTAKAGFCVSATAERDGMHLVAVIMGAETRDIRNREATKLLDYGFANYGIYNLNGASAGELKVTGGELDRVSLYYDSFSCLAGKGKGKIDVKYSLPESVSAPLVKGDAVGEVIFTLGGKEVGRSKVYAAENVGKLGYFGIWWRMLGKVLMK